MTKLMDKVSHIPVREYIIERRQYHQNETVEQFHTRVTNEIMTWYRCRILSANITDDRAVFTYQNLSK